MKGLSKKIKTSDRQEYGDYVLLSGRQEQVKGGQTVMEGGLGW